MLTRIGYTLRQAWYYRQDLLAFAKADDHCQTVLSLTEADLVARGVEVLVLDFDGVLAPHGAVEMLPDVAAWLKTMTMPIYILSNKPFAERLAALATHHPRVRVITGVKKKPYPDGLAAVVAAANVEPKAVLLVDDRLLTGILATRIAKCQGVWVRSAYQDYRRRPFSELGFSVLRQLEKKGIALFAGLCRR